MASLVLQITDDSLLVQLQKACAMLKGVGEVRIVPTSVTLEDIIHSEGYAESMEDIRMGRVYKADSSEDMFKQSDFFE